MKPHPSTTALSGQPANASIVTATADSLPEQPQVLARARAFAEPLLGGQTLDSGEGILAHADAVASILHGIGSPQALQASIYLVHASTHLSKPLEVIGQAFGASHAALAVETTRLITVQRQARNASVKAPQHQAQALQTENVRKMLLAFSRDLRVVILRLASRLQTLRYYAAGFAATRQPAPAALASESLHVFAPLANRLGIWQIKWEMEDLAFRFLEPDTYKQIAQLLDEKRTEREQFMDALRAELEQGLNAAGIAALVQGRPKHIYSIVKKMRGKSLDFEQVFDVRALRVIAPDVPGCYAALGFVHAAFSPIVGEFDDYIAKPKPNGYQSLHTVVRDEAGRALEIQIRTQAMHDHAEYGVAAHWAYKEAGARGYAGAVSADSEYDAKIAVLRQLIAWERDLTAPASEQSGVGSQELFSDRIYVLTPDAAIIELPRGATAVDFAYSVHTSLGHRCRGARIDGAMAPLHTPLRNGQSVEIITTKEGGPSRDWLNPELGFLTSHRARSKVRAWFNAIDMAQTVAKGREAVEKLLQREGKTAVRLDDLAAQLGLKAAEDLFEVVGKDELSLRTIENLLRPAVPTLTGDDYVLTRKSRPSSEGATGGVLVVGMGSLLTQLAKCCRPAPPDPIRGFVTRGNGVSVHRADCSNFRNMASGTPERAIDVSWSGAGVADAPLSTPGGAAVYPVDIVIEAGDRQGLLRDISEVFAKEKINVIGVQSQSSKDSGGGIARLVFTVEVAQSGRLGRVLLLVLQVAGVRAARRR